MMKSPMLLNATFFFLFVLLATTLPQTRATINMFDVDGEPLRSGSTYYMLPVASGSGGGPMLRKTGNDKCPLTISQDADSSSSGLPVRLTDSQGVYHVQENFATIVQFAGRNVPSCVPSPGYWGKVGKNLKYVGGYQSFTFQDYYVNPGKYNYVIADCYFYDSRNCSRVVSVNKTLIWSKTGKPFVVKFKWTFVNSERDPWSIV